MVFRSRSVGERDLKAGALRCVARKKLWGTQMTADNREWKTESSRDGLFSALLILISTLLAYGSQITRLGFYRDDWYLVWTWQAQAAQGMLNLFRGDRPFIGWLYTLDFSFLGISPLHWQLY